MDKTVTYKGDKNAKMTKENKKSSFDDEIIK